MLKRGGAQDLIWRDAVDLPVRATDIFAGGFCGLVPPLRLERRFLPPEGNALSTELWGHL